LKSLDPTPTSSGVLARYIDLAHTCREHLVEEYTRLFRNFQEELPDILLKLADRAESNVMQAHCMDVRQEITEHRDEMNQAFYNELMAGFENFILGKQSSSSEEKDETKPTQRQKRLSLVEKEAFEIELSFDTIANSACVNHGELLYGLNLRLAVINGGHKPGERSATLPGSPHHVCNAYRAALAIVQIPIDTAVKISLIEEFDKHVLRQSASIYQEYNRLLIKAGILPNPEDTPLYTPPKTSAKKTKEPPADKPSEHQEEAQAPTAPQTPRPQPVSNGPRQAPPASPSSNRPPPTQGTADTREEILEQEVFQQIRQLLQQRRTPAQAPTSAPPPPALGGSAPPSTPSSANGHSQELTALIAELSRRDPGAGHATLVAPDIAVQPLEKIREEFSAQLAELSEMIKKHHLDHSDADVIELVGMLLELVLNDPNLPDSVKALLSHLHTPYLKVALLDRRFFFKRRHPARRLLNLLSQAGSLCNATEKNEKLVFDRMRKTVNTILTEFDDNLELFESLMTDFEAFLDKFQKQARIMEKRSIEKAKGQEKLREARQRVARELVQILQGANLPKAAEKLLFGPWSNLLVLLYLRKGAEDSVRQHYLAVTKDIVWSVQPKATPQEQYQLKKRLPAIQQSIQEGLALLGDPDSRAEVLIQELSNCHQEALRPSKKEAVSPHPLLDNSQYLLLQDIDADDLLDQKSNPKQHSEELKKIISQLQKIKLGTWFEMENPKEGPPLRAKLSWFSHKTSFYIFVNQAGIQVAVKPLKKLAQEMLDGKIRILELDRKPFVERTLQRIYTLLNQPALS